MRQHMEKKAAQELLRRDGHQLLFAAVRVILPAESDLAISEGDNPVVGNNDAMCVAGQVMKTCCGPPKGVSRRLPSLDGTANEEKNGKPVLG
jgi:hypothetical protein